MPKFAVIKDPHYKFGFTNTIRRNYDQDLIDKNRQLINIMKERNINTLLIPGDVFDESYGNRWRFQAYQINKAILKEFLDNGIKIVAIPGNHDYFDGYEDSARKINIGDKEIYQYTVYGDMVNDGIITDVSFTTEHPKSIHGVIINDVFVTGIRYRSDLDIVREELSQINNKVKMLGVEKVIVMLHQNVTPKSVTHITEFTYEELATSYENIDVFLLGHYHIGYEPQQVNNKWFVNPFNFTRVNRNYETRMDKHIPEVAIVDIDDKTYDINVEQIKLKVKAFEDAFIPEYVSFLKLTKEELKKDSLDLNLESGMMSDEEIIAKVAKEHNFSDEVIQYVVDKMNSIEK